MAWAKSSSVTGDASSTTLTTGTIDATTFSQAVFYVDTFVGGNMRLNGDTGSNYARRYSANGAADETSASNDKMNWLYDLAPAFTVSYFINISAEEKLVLSFDVEQNTAGAGSAPNRMELVFKWSNTAAQITEYAIAKTSTNFTTAVNLTVLRTD